MAKSKSIHMSSGNVDYILRCYRDGKPDYSEFEHQKDYDDPPLPINTKPAIEPKLGDKLWYIDKHTGSLGFVIFACLREDKICFRYKSKFYWRSSELLGTKLFLTKAGARRASVAKK